MFGAHVNLVTFERVDLPSSPSQFRIKQKGKLLIGDASLYSKCNIH